MHKLTRFGLTAATLVASGLLLIASPVQAAGLTTLQIQAIESLLVSFGASASVIANVNAALTHTPVSGASNSASTASDTTATPACPSLTLSFSIGASDATTDGQVSALQQALGLSATGYFGTQTQAALQQFQASHGIVSAGSPSATGYGAVGPATREAFANICASSLQGVSPTAVTPQPVIPSVTSTLPATSSTPSAPSAETPVISNFSASATSINPGQSVTFSWSATNVQGGGCPLFLSTNQSQAIDPSSSYSGLSSGSYTFSPTATANYILQCESSFKDGAPAASQQLTVAVSGTTPSVVAAASAAIDQSSLAATVGAVTITGTAANATSLGVLAYNAWAPSTSVQNIPVVNGRWSATLTIPTSGTYTVYVTASGTQVATGTLLVNSSTTSAPNSPSNSSSVSATINPSSLTQPQSFAIQLTGTATNSTGLSVFIQPSNYAGARDYNTILNSTVIYATGDNTSAAVLNVRISNGQWFATFSGNAFNKTSGTYLILVYDTSSQTLLATGTLTVQ